LKVLKIKKIISKLFIRNKKKIQNNNLNSPIEKYVSLLCRKIVKISNIILLIINIYFLLVKKNNIHQTNLDINKNLTDFRNVDFFIISLLSNSYKGIVNYLNNKYNKYDSSNFVISRKKRRKKKIRLHALNLCSEEEFKRTLLWYLKDKFYIRFDKNNPDYLIYNVFGNNEDNKKYNNCIKIALYTENVIPDLTNCDYAIGHAHISYLDRYFIHPFCFLRKLNLTKDLNLTEIRNTVIKNPRKKFCASVFTNVSPISNDFFRLKFIDELNKYKQVDMGGRYKNNVGGPVKDKIEFLLDYKFSIAMENTNGDGYISEKIVESFISGTIPIYYGSYMIDEYINPKSYILINGPEDMYQKIEYIKKIDNDDQLYKNILKEKVFVDEKILQKAQKEQSDFLIHIFEQDKNKAKRNIF
jgi:hypothetical protein